MTVTKVAICTLLEDSKASLIPLLLPRWNGIDLGPDREGQFIVCRQDASDETAADFTAGARWPVRMVSVPNLDELVPKLPVVTSDCYGNWRWLARIAFMREAVRQAALATDATWFLWLDSDIDPEDGVHPSFGCLHQVLTDTVGPHAPKLVTGLYCTRFGGVPIGQWIDGNLKRYLPVYTGRQQFTRVAGFGCMAMHRQTLEAVSWDGYLEHCQRVETAREASPDSGIGHLGEDVWFERLVELWCGVPCVTDNRVVCKHFHGDGSYWSWREDGDQLVPCYIPAGLAPGAGIMVRYTGEEALTWPILGRSEQGGVQPGDVLSISPELLETFKLVIPDDFEVLGEAA